MMNRPWVLALAPLLIIATAITASAQSTVCWYYWPNVTINPGQGLLVQVTGGSYGLYVFTPSQYTKWSRGMATYSLYSTQVNVGAYLVRIPPGTYYVVLYPVKCGQLVNARVIAIGLAPTGVSSMMPMNTTAVLGYFSISSMSAWNSSYTAVNVIKAPMSGASLQLNAVVVVKLSNGSVQEYWVQDALMFITDAKVLNVADNTWNFTEPNANVSSYLVKGLGSVHTYFAGSYYGYLGKGARYNLPLAGYLEVNVTVINGSVVVMFGYTLIRNGSIYGPPVIKWFDNVTLGVNASGAFIETTPYSLTGNGGSYDVELVFGGYYSGEQTTFESMYAQLAIMYWDGFGWSPYQDIYNFGLNTGESATDLVASIAQNGNVQLTVGIPYYGLLSSVFKPTIPTSFVEVIYPNGTSLSFYVLNETTVTLPPVIRGSGVLYLFKGLLVNQNGAVRLLGNNSITITPTSGEFSVNVIIGNYSRYILLSLSSTFPINVTLPNGTFTTTKMVSWVEAGSRVIIKVKYAYLFNNLTRFITLNSTAINLTITKPLNLTIGWVRQYMVNVSSVVPISINGTLMLHFIDWVNEDSTIRLLVPRFTYFGNGTRFMALNASTISLTVTGPINAMVTWVRQYFVKITSPVPITVNGSNVANATLWVNAGGIINVTIPRYYMINGNVRLRPLNTSTLVTVDGPLNLTVTWVRQFLVRVLSPVPVLVNGSLTVNFTGWVNELSVLFIEAPGYYWFNNGSRLMLLNQSRIRLVINGPINATIAWVRQYMVNLVSVAPVTVNDTTVKVLSGWFNEGSVLNVTLSAVNLGNGTRLIPLNESGVVKVNKPLNLTVSWLRQYLVTVSSPLAINVNGTWTRSYVNWVNAGDLLIIKVARARVGANMTIIKPIGIVINGVLHHALTVNATVDMPLTITVEWGVSYIAYYALALLAVILVAIALLIRARGG